MHRTGLGSSGVSYGRHGEKMSRIASCLAPNNRNPPWHACDVSLKWEWASMFTARDATKAARRAVSDAIRRYFSVGFFRMVGKTAHDMFVDVTVGVPDPGAVDTSAVAKELPYGTVTVTAVKGGLEVPAEQGQRCHHHRQCRRDRQSR